MKALPKVVKEDSEEKENKEFSSQRQDAIQGEHSPGATRIWTIIFLISLVNYPDIQCLFFAMLSAGNWPDYNRSVKHAKRLN